MEFQFRFQFGLKFAAIIKMLAKFTVFQVSKQFYWTCKSLKIHRFLHEQLMRFYSIALGSLRECQAIIELERIEDARLHDLANQLGAMLFKLSRMKGHSDN